MGAVNRILITGASGFVGSAALRAARDQGFEVIALYRGLPHAAWEDDLGITAVKLDLTAADATERLSLLVNEVGSIIHAAAHLGDDAAAHDCVTLGGTQALLSALENWRGTFVLVSSIAVYDTVALAPGDALDETCALTTAQKARDAYSKAKLTQEALVQEAMPDAWLIRPGAVWGAGRTWNALLGFWAAKVFVQIGKDGALPLVHVDHLGETLIRAAQKEPKGTVSINVVDDDLPDRRRFVSVHKTLTGWPRFVLPITYDVWLKLARLLRPISAGLPGLFQEPIIRARLMPLRYPNAALRATLGGKDHAPFEEMMAQSIAGEP